MKPSQFASLPVLMTAPGGDIEEEEDVILTFESEQGTAIQQQVRDAALRAKTKK